MNKNSRKGKIKNLEEQVIELRDILNLLSKKMGRSSIGIMGFPINAPQLRAMAAFDENIQYTMGELCKISQVTMPSMTEMVDKFVARGIVERVRDTRDRRVVKVILTDKGKKAHKKIMTSRDKGLIEMFEKLSGNDLDALMKSLTKVTAIFNKVTE